MFDKIERLLDSVGGRLLFSFVLVAVITMPGWSGWKVYGDDATALLIPQLAFYKNAFAENISPFWNPNVAVGFPNFVSILHPYAPTVWLVRLFSPIMAHYIGLLTILTLTLFFAVSFLRRLGIGVWGAWIGGLSYLMAASWFTKTLLISIAIFDQAIIYWVILRVYQSSNVKQKIFPVCLGIFAVGLAWLSIGYWYNLYLFFVGVAFAIFLTFKDRRALVKLVVILLLIWGIGTFIGLFQIIPTYVINQLSGRSGGFDPQSAQGYAISLPELLNFFYLTPRRGLDAYLYLGIVPLIFLFFSLYSKNRFKKFFWPVFLLFLAVAIRDLPLFGLIHRLPGFNFFQGAARFLLLSNFASAVLVGLGAQQDQEWRNGGDQSAVRRKFNFIAAGIGVVLIAAAIFYQANLPVLVSLLISIAILAPTSLIFWKLLSRSIFLPFLLLLTIFDLTLFFYRLYSPEYVDQAKYNRGAPTTEVLEQLPRGRIFPLFADDWDDLYFYQLAKAAAPHFAEAPYLFDLERASYKPNYQNLDGIENLEINDPLLNIEMGRLLALVGTRQLVTTGGEEKLNKLYRVIDTPTGVVRTKNGKTEVEYNRKDISVVERLKTFKQRLPLVSFLGVKYILSIYSLEEGEAKIAALEPITYISADIMGRGYPPIQVFIYENPAAKPIAYFTKVSGYKTDPQEIYGAFKAGGFKDIFVECSDCLNKKLSGAGQILLEKRENALVSLKTSAATEQFLVFTQNYLPGWRAFVDDAEVKMYKVNTVFPGVFVPAGEHKVVFKYDYWSLFSPKLIFGKK